MIKSGRIGSQLKFIAARLTAVVIGACRLWLRRRASPALRGVAREFLLPDDPKPMTVRFDVINLFDTVYQIRSGSGIGVFAPQFGPRIGYFLGVSKKF